MGESQTANVLINKSYIARAIHRARAAAAPLVLSTKMPEHFMDEKVFRDRMPFLEGWFPLLEGALLGGQSRNAQTQDHDEGT